MQRATRVPMYMLTRSRLTSRMLRIHCIFHNAGGGWTAELQNGLPSPNLWAALEKMLYIRNISPDNT